MYKKIKLRVSDSIEPFREKAKIIWGLESKKRGEHDCDAVFFGLYHLGDWISLILNKGKRYVLWAGGDIENLKRGYAFSDGRKLWLSKLFSLVPWFIIFKIFKAEHYCENGIEWRDLKRMGIKSKIVPSFLEDINNFKICFKSPEKFNVYLSARPGRKEEYGVHLVESIADQLPDIIFHMYGFGTIGELLDMKPKNIIYHGIVSPEQFNKDIKNYHCGLRPNEHDGFSEITAKCILMGQYPITKIKYQKIDNFQTKEELVALLKKLKEIKHPNIEGRDFYRKILNQYPWTQKKY